MQTHHFRCYRPFICFFLAQTITACFFSAALRGATWPDLPTADGVVRLPAQEWPFRRGPREVEVAVHYPMGELSAVGDRTGLMLTLHNWGGTFCVGTADPHTLASRYNVVALCVNYLQSGQESIDGPEPYDHGYLQALDALRALWWLDQQLQDHGLTVARGRTYVTGGSGGGNVTLMCLKFAPRSFAAAIDLCGMKQLSDDVAFNLPGGSDLDARYSRDPASAAYLSPDAQEIRNLSCPEHLFYQWQLGSTFKTLVVHGRDDSTCPFAEAEQFVQTAQAMGLDVEPHFIGQDQVDGQAFHSTGHALGDRTAIVERVADCYLLPDGSSACVRSGPPDWELREEIRYRTSGGDYVIDYSAGFPVGRFVAAPSPITYPDHVDLTYWMEEGDRRPIQSTANWETRRGHLLANFQRVVGHLPGPCERVPLEIETHEEETLPSGIVRRKISFQSDCTSRVTAYLLLPPAATKPRAAVLCLHQTYDGGKEEPAGVSGSADLHYALELAERGFVTLAPDYPSFGDYEYDFATSGYASGTLKAVWDNLRAVDLLVSLPEVDPARVGVIGHSLGGHSAIFTAALEPRLKVVVSSCGFSRMHRDDVPSWNGPRYMPRIATEFENSADLLPWDFPELIASLAPRPFFASAAEGDNDFDVEGVRETLAAAQTVYELYGVEDSIVGYYPPGPHAFPTAARKQAYAFLEQHLIQPNE